MDFNKTQPSQNSSDLYSYTNNAFSSEDIILPELHDNRHSVASTVSVTSVSPIVNNSTETNHKKYPSKKRPSFWKDMTLLGLAFVWINIASSERNLNAEDDLRSVTPYLKCVYTILFAIFLPSYVIEKLGFAKTMAISTILITCYNVADIFPSWGSLMPTIFLFGIGYALLFVATPMYIVEVSKEYAFLIGETAQQIIMQFMGYIFLYSNIISLINYIIVVASSDKNVSFTEFNVSSYCDPLCNVNCTSNMTNLNTSNHYENDNNETSVYYALGISILFSILAIVMFSLLHEEMDVSKEKLSPFSHFTGTLVQMKDLKQILLIPLSLFVSMQSYFIYDMSEALLICQFGNWTVNYAMICLFFVDAIFSFGCPWIIKIFGRLAVFTFAAIINIMVTFIILFWSPTPDKLGVLFALFGFWGLADAVWMPQVVAYYGVVFHKIPNAGFSNYCVWRMFGFILSYATTNLLIVEKIYLLLSLLICSMIGYYVTEILRLKQYNV